MATRSHHPAPSRFALRQPLDRQSPYGAWWPSNRTLSDQLDGFFALWPPDRGHIQRILYSPPDWDDHPRAVDVRDRRVKTGSFPHDDTHQLTLAMSTGERRTITVIPPDTSPDAAALLLAEISGHPAQKPDTQPRWENEGGRV